MFIELTLTVLTAYILEVAMQHFWIGKMHRMKIEQVTKMYGPSWHDKAKMGTPSMGGVVFIPALLLTLVLPLYLGMLSADRLAMVLSYPIAAAAVGFIDDWLKHSRNSSEGLRSLQKLALQIAVTLPWAVWTVGGPLQLLPHVMLPRAAGVLLVTFLGVGIQNAVNVTDGLDGLAAGCSLISFAGALMFLNPLHETFVCAAASCGVCLGFLWHNANPAKVFMGDAGAHFLAGMLISLCVNTGALIIIVPLGFIFGLEIISVAIQIFAIRVCHRKVFLMSPIHHHFELMGWKENQIVVRFCIIHMLGLSVCVCLLFLLAHLA